MEPQPPDLIRRAVSGNSSALGELLRKVEAQVRLVIQIKPCWRGQIEVDDVMQVTFMDASQQIHKFVGRTESAFVKWLQQSALNNLCDAERALACEKRRPPKKRMSIQPSDDSDPDLRNRLYAKLSTPSRIVSLAEGCERLERAVRQLPPEYEVVVRRMDLASEPIQQVAAELRKSRATVYMIRSRAHARLHELLADEMR